MKLRIPNLTMRVQVVNDRGKPINEWYALAITLLMFLLVAWLAILWFLILAPVVGPVAAVLIGWAFGSLPWLIATKPRPKPRRSR